MGNHKNNIKNEKINQKNEIKPNNNNKLILIKDKIEMKAILTDRGVDYLFLLKDKRIIVSFGWWINIYNEELLEIDLTFKKNEGFLQKIAQLKDEKVLFLYNRSICILRINKNSFSVSQYITLFNVIDCEAWNEVDWLNKKMFAYRTIDGKDMFELGLALEAPDGMYDLKKK
jgi:hypothetical protein